MRAPRAGTTAMAVLAVALLAIGIWQTGSGIWIYVKAQLAQVLLQHAWASTLKGQTHVKPWPWADTWPVARLIVPAHDADMIVLAGAYGRTLAFGPGYLESSAPPGQKGTTVLTGHRDTHFRVLQRLKEGDDVIVEIPDRSQHRYRVRDTRIIDARIAQVVMNQATPQLALITCYPFEGLRPGTPYRYVVLADAAENMTLAPR